MGESVVAGIGNGQVEKINLAFSFCGFHVVMRSISRACQEHRRGAAPHGFPLQRKVTSVTPGLEACGIALFSSDSALDVPQFLLPP